MTSSPLTFRLLNQLGELGRGTFWTVRGPGIAPRLAKYSSPPSLQTGGQQHPTLLALLAEGFHALAFFGRILHPNRLNIIYVTSFLLI